MGVAPKKRRRKRLDCSRLSGESSRAEPEFTEITHLCHVHSAAPGTSWASTRMAQRRAVERDEDEIRRWVKEEWPRVKKTPRG